LNIVFFTKSWGFSGSCIRDPASAPPVVLTYTKCSSLILGSRILYKVSLPHPVIVDLFGVMLGPIETWRMSRSKLLNTSIFFCQVMVFIYLG
ncbi:MAG: hypothetical protein ACTSRA_20285, partial [Promethearchaeota archaeon]